MAMITPPRPTTLPIKICGSCSAGYDGAAWERLEACGAIAGAALKAVVTGWSEAALVDLRRCARCSMILARLRSK